jgi:flagellar biosynthesis chaperone FliJ
MKTLELDLIAKKTLKYWREIIILVLVFLCYTQCTGNSDLELANSSLKSEVKTYISNAKQLVDKNNALEEDKVKYQDSISDLKTEVKKKQSQIVDVNKKVIRKVNEVRTLKYREIARYYVDRYKMPKEVKSTNLGTALTDTLAKLNITELVRYDGLKDKLKITKEVLSLEKNISVKKDSIISSVEKQNVNLELAIKENEKAIDSQSKIIDNTEKMFKKQKRKTTFYKITTVIAVVTGSYLLLK